MSVELKESNEGKILEVHVTGKLTKADFNQFAPEVERLIGRHRKIRILLEMSDFHGWDPAGLWEETKFGFQHISDIEKIAMVGEKKWQEWVATFCRPFTKAQVQYFDRTAADQAERWLQAA